MKKFILIIGCILLVGLAFAQHAHDETGCDCPTCKAKADGKFTLPGLEALNKPETACEHEREDHEDHDHDQPAHKDHEGHDPVGHEGHSHTNDTEACCPQEKADVQEKRNHDAHAGHDHSDHEAEGIKLSAEMAEKVGVKLQNAQEGIIARSSGFPAEIKLNRDQTVAVSPRYPSIVRQVFAEIGDTVRKGDVLASLENRQTMAVYSVSAPRDGIIISKNLSAGEAASEERILYEVADLSSVWADISIFPKYQHLIRKGMGVELVAHDGHTARGTVQYISPLISHETRTFTARCVLEGADEDFTPGAFVRARIVVEQADVSVAVPFDAVQILDGESVIFVPTETGFQTLEIQTGLSDGKQIQILSGLKPGDSYVAEGAFALKAQIVTRGIDPHAGHGH